MAVKHFNLPDPGEGLLEAEIVSWKVNVGDVVKVNDIVVEIETAKSLVELPAPYAGTVTAILVSEGDTVAVGTPIISVDDGLGGDVAPVAAPTTTVGGTFKTAASDDDEQIEAGKIGGAAPGGRVAVLVGYGPRVTEAKRRPRKSAGAHTLAAVPLAAAPVSEPVVTGKALAKPPVRKFAKDLGINLAKVVGSGEGGIVTRADVEAYVAGGVAEAGNGAGAGAYTAPLFAATGERETRIPIKGVRKLTAQAMVASAFTAPHVTEFITVDVTAMMRLVERLRTDPEFRDVKVSPLLVVAKALIIASGRNPGINATWDESAQEVVVKNFINLGIAAATPRGLLV